MIGKELEHYVRHFAKRFLIFLKWLAFSILSGILVGSVGAVFHYCILYGTNAREKYPWLIFLLPAAGLLIVGVYHLMRNEEDTGTNLVLSAIHSGKHIPLRMAPLIFISTVMTHLFGGSAGREGAALQLGGSIGNSLGRFLKFDEKDQHIMIMCGMSAAFSVLFGTPLAAAVFSMEVVSVGIMHYAALVPCVVSSLVAQGIGEYCRIAPEQFLLASVPEFTISSAVITALLAILCAVVSALFCIALHMGEALYKKYLPNPYLRIVAGGLLIILLTLLVGNQDYNGAGMPIIARCFAEHEVVPYAFLMKILFTAITLGAGYKGGEIVPSFFIGAVSLAIWRDLRRIYVLLQAWERFSAASPTVPSLPCLSPLNSLGLRECPISCCLWLLGICCQAITDCTTARKLCIQNIKQNLLTGKPADVLCCCF